VTARSSNIGLGDLLRAGARALSRYTGTLLVVFVVQSLIAAACMLAVAMVLAQAFAHLPMFDDAVDGDLVSLIACLRWAKPSLHAIVGIAVGALLVWQLATWFVVGGLVNVMARKPEGRADTARAFGAGGAATYLAYARLALCALPSYALVVFAFSTGLHSVSGRLDQALTLSDVVLPLLLAALPAIVLLHVAWTIVDYTRVELSLRYETHPPSVAATYVRTAAFVITHPISLVHAGLGWLLFLAVWIGYAYFAKGHAMYGAEGAVTLFVIRQGVSLARTAVRFATIAGEVELGKSRALPARRVEAKAG
jgi:hypothetical protein